MNFKHLFMMILMMFSFSAFSNEEDSIGTEIVSQGNVANQYLGQGVRMAGEVFDVKVLGLGGSDAGKAYQMTILADVQNQTFIIKMKDMESGAVGFAIQNQNAASVSFGEQTAFMNPLLIGVQLWALPIDARMIFNWTNGQTQYSVEPVKQTLYAENIPKTVEQGAWQITYDHWGFIGSEEAYIGAPKAMTVSYNNQPQFEFTFVRGTIVEDYKAKPTDTLGTFFNLEDGSF